MICLVDAKDIFQPAYMAYCKSLGFLRHGFFESLFQSLAVVSFICFVSMLQFDLLRACSVFIPHQSFQLLLHAQLTFFDFVLTALYIQEHL